jgi:large subunit ribosomal protein L10
VARPDKVAVVDDVKARMTSSAATLLTDYRGLTVAELSQLRAELRKTNASYRIAKNTLMRRAASEAGFEGLDELLVGPTALVFCEDDPVGPAKALKAFAKDHPELVVKGGYLDGQVLDEAEAVKLADLASRDELLATLAGLMYGALANTARLLKAPIEKQARLIQALIDAGGAPGAPTEAQAPAAAAEDVPAAAETDEAPVTEAPEASADEAPAEDAPAEDSPAEDTPAEDAAAEDAPADED